MKKGFEGGEKTDDEREERESHKLNTGKGMGGICS